MSLVHHQSSVTEPDHFLSFTRQYDDRQALFRKVQDNVVYFFLGPHINPLSGVVQDKDLRPGRQPFGQDNLLLVSARQRVYRVGDPLKSDTQPFPLLSKQTRVLFLSMTPFLAKRGQVTMEAFSIISMSLIIAFSLRLRQIPYAQFKGMLGALDPTSRPSSQTIPDWMS